MRVPSLLVAVCGVASVLGAPAPAGAMTPGHVDLTVLAGFTQPDPKLVDYQWQEDAQPNIGGQILVGRGRFGLGARGWVTTNRQQVEIPGVLSADLDVRLVAAEAVLRLDLLSASGWSLFAQGAGGWMRLSYGTEALRFVPSGSQSEIEVPLDSVDGWIASGGLGTRYRLPVGIAIGAHVDRHVFDLEAAHRSGEVIVHDTETFGQWTARAELGWSF